MERFINYNIYIILIGSEKKTMPFNPKRKYGMITFYIKEEFRPIFDKFIDYIEKDERLQPKRYRKNAGMISIAIVQLITSYVKKKDQDEGVVQQPEVQNDIINNEAEINEDNIN